MGLEIPNVLFSINITLLTELFIAYLWKKTNKLSPERA
jgi:hypothetical protein